MKRVFSAEMMKSWIIILVKIGSYAFSSFHKFSLQLSALSFMITFCSIDASISLRFLVEWANILDGILPYDMWQTKCDEYFIGKAKRKL
jgi:hypothetical protein